MLFRSVFKCKSNEINYTMNNNSFFVVNGATKATHFSRNWREKLIFKGATLKDNTLEKETKGAANYIIPWNLSFWADIYNVTIWNVLHFCVNIFVGLRFKVAIYFKEKEFFRIVKKNQTESDSQLWFVSYCITAGPRVTIKTFSLLDKSTTKQTVLYR